MLRQGEGRHAGEVGDQSPPEDVGRHAPQEPHGEPQPSARAVHVLGDAAAHVVVEHGSQLQPLEQLALEPMEGLGLPGLVGVALVEPGEWKVHVRLLKG